MSIAIEMKMLIIFIMQVIINWLYVLWANSQPAIITSWVALSSLLAFIYFAFAVIACGSIYGKSKQGLLLACCVIVFGMISAVISYSLAFQHHNVGELLIIPIIILNICVILYLAFNQRFFK